MAITDSALTTGNVKISLSLIPSCPEKERGNQHTENNRSWNSV
jgi:hypothetical protein